MAAAQKSAPPHAHVAQLLFEEKLSMAFDRLWDKLGWPEPSHTKAYTDPGPWHYTSPNAATMEWETEADPSGVITSHTNHILSRRSAHIRGCQLGEDRDHVFWLLDWTGTVGLVF
ncbi:Hypothetical predicted protein [Pelobates cultripes]|uniref:Uncharacterized protein n=1 Tax=Pelobates cultripes TaxID=61616 RepID=A0AAD1SIM5_PELCU|nr:Hypothetical predicted protein [Pelobates cultripes]